jgi:hypothetical protein
MTNTITNLLDTVTVGVRDERVPKSFTLYQSYPNPFNPSTTIDYDITAEIFVSLKIYNVLGQEVGTLVHQQQRAGSYSVTFDASHLPSGVYFYRLEAGSYTNMKKMVLIR